MPGKSHFHADRIANVGMTIFSEMTRLAQEHNAVNLGQGFPDFDGPQEIKRLAMEAIASGKNQYAPMIGLPALRRAIARHQSRFYVHEVDPDLEVTVTTGATEGLLCTLLAFINPGDEVIVFEPCYDSYVPVIRMAGGIPVPVTLHEPLFKFNHHELREAFTDKTKAIIINTPHNPTGMMFNQLELGYISDLCQEFDALAILDEVYEHIVFNQSGHVQMRSLPDMKHRTITISSLGKTCSFTGWKIGWVIAPEELTLHIRNVHQYTVFSTATPFQGAAAAALDLPDSFYSGLIEMYREKRDFLAHALAGAGLHPILPDGAYFIMADTSDYPFPNMRAFSSWLIKEIGIACIPNASFYLRPERAGNYVRFCFCKNNQTLELAAERLSLMRS
ncbi:MAG: methionine aminotransferase [Candidatus Kapaibacteriota bacterium]|jgi:N-succinyldiaminopimelate aminotransferase